MLGTFRRRRDLVLLLLVIASACSREPQLSGDFLGQGPPPAQPAIFAPGIVNTGARTRDVTIGRDGNEICWTSMIGGGTTSAILGSRIEDGHWTAPAVMPFSADARWRDLEPHLSPDGRQLLLVSDRPDTARGQADGNEDIWVCTRDVGGWSAPVDLGPPINTPAPEYFPSLTEGGVLYFTRRDPSQRRDTIWRAQPRPDGGYEEPVELPAEVNSGVTQFNAFVAPDESYLIVSVVGRTDNLGQVDYVVCFRRPDDTWLAPINLGATINGAGKEGWSCSVSPDGRAFFFMTSRRDPQPGALTPLTLAKLLALNDTPGNGNGHVWWMATTFLDSLRARAG